MNELLQNHRVNFLHSLLELYEISMAEINTNPVFSPNVNISAPSCGFQVCHRNHNGCVDPMKTNLLDVLFSHPVKSNRIILESDRIELLQHRYIVFICITRVNIEGEYCQICKLSY